MDMTYDLDATITKQEAASLNAIGWEKMKLALPKKCLERLAIEFGMTLDCYVPIMVCNDLVYAVIMELEQARSPLPGEFSTGNLANQADVPRLLNNLSVPAEANNQDTES
jgi:hypothetical protein